MPPLRYICTCLDSERDRDIDKSRGCGSESKGSASATDRFHVRILTSSNARSYLLEESFVGFDGLNEKKFCVTNILYLTNQPRNRGVMRCYYSFGTIKKRHSFYDCSFEIAH